MAMAEVGFSLLILECPCGHQWVEYFQMGVALGAFLSRLKGAGTCPACANDKDVMILSGKRYREAVSDLGLSSFHGGEKAQG